MNRTLVTLLCFTLSVAACAGKTKAVKMPHAVPQAVAEIRSLGDSGIAGRAVFAGVATGGVQVYGEIRGLTPNSSHGFHIHEVGDCSATDGMSAGGHFNPTHKEHGNVDSTDSHVGDLGNLVADAAGVARFSVFKSEAVLGATEGNVIGRSLLVHALVDDLKTQPTGASGARVACGVIAAVAKIEEVN